MIVWPRIDILELVGKSLGRTDFMMKLNKLSLIAIMATGQALGAMSPKIEEIQDLYKQPLVFVESLQLEHARNDYKTLVALCSCFNLSFCDLSKQLRSDMRCVQRAIKCDKYDEDLRHLYNQLKELLSYVKRHKLIYEAIVFHNHVHDVYQVLFDMVDNNQDVIAYIDAHRESFDLEDGDDFLKEFVQDVKKASRTISKYEDYVHADYIDLKLQNYVYKIEFIKLRNAILFDKRYKN